MTDLFSWTPPAPKTGEQLRDDGIAIAEIGQMLVSPAWSDRAYAAIYRLAETQAEVHIDDVLQAFTDKPSHPNAWGGVWQRLIRKGVIARSGRMATCKTDKAKHAHQYPIYTSLIHVPAPPPQCDCQHPETTPSGFAAVSMECPIHGDRW